MFKLIIKNNTMFYDYENIKKINKYKIIISIQME